MRFLIPTLRPLIEDLAGTLVFYVLYLLTGSATWGVTIGVAVGVGQIARHRWRGEPLPALLLIGVAMTVVLGGVSAMTRDVRFLLVKPSIVYGCIGVAMLRGGWVTRYVPPLALELLPQATFDCVGWGWAALMLATAATNLALVASLRPRDAALMLVIAATASKAVLFAVQYAVLRRRGGRAYATRRYIPAARTTDSIAQ